MKDMNSSVLVRPIRAEDFDSLLELTQTTFRREIETGGFDAQRFKRNARLYGLIKLLMPILDFFKRDYPTIQVATIDGEVVGEVHLVPIGRKRWTIDSLAVNPDYGRRGVGFALIKESVDYVARRQAQKVLSSMRTDNVPANKIAQKLGYRIFEERITLISEIDKLPKLDSNDISTREAKPKDTKQILEIAETADTVKTQAFETATEDFTDSLFQTTMNRIIGTHSKKFVAELQGRIVGYAQTIYTSSKEAARIEPFYLRQSDDLPKVASSLLSKIADYLASRRTARIITSVSAEHRETIETLTKLGFTTVANMYWYICLDRKTEQQTK